MTTTTKTTTTKTTTVAASDVGESNRKSKRKAVSFFKEAAEVVELDRSVSFVDFRELYGCPTETEDMRLRKGTPPELLDPDGFLGLRWFRKSTPGDYDVANPVATPATRPTSSNISRTKSSRHLTLEDICYGDEDRGEREEGKGADENDVDLGAELVTERTGCDTKRTDAASLFQPGIRKRVKAAKAHYGPTFKIICRQTSSVGAREYAITWMPDFLDAMAGREPFARTFNELVEEDVPCRLYLDLDIDLPPQLAVVYPAGTRSRTPLSRKKARWVAVHRKLKSALHRVCLNLAKQLSDSFGLVNCDRGTLCADGHVLECVRSSQISWVTLDSSCIAKFSKHVIFTVFEDRCLFKEKSQVGYFVNHCLSQQKKTLSDAHFGGSIEPGDRAEIRIKPGKKWNIYDDFEDDEPFKITDPVAELAVLEYMDRGVYFGEKELRMLESTKLDGGQVRPLVVESTAEIFLRHAATSERLSELRSYPELVTVKRYLANYADGSVYRKNIVWSDDGPPVPCRASDGERPLDSLIYDEDDVLEEPAVGDRGASETAKEPDVGYASDGNDGDDDRKVYCPTSKVYETLNASLKEIYGSKGISPLASTEGEIAAVVDGGELTDLDSVRDFRDLFYATLVIPFPSKVFWSNDVSFDSTRSSKVALMCFVDRAAESERNKASLLTKRAKTLAKMSSFDPATASKYLEYKKEKAAAFRGKGKPGSGSSSYMRCSRSIVGTGTGHLSSVFYNIRPYGKEWSDELLLGKGTTAQGGNDGKLPAGDFISDAALKSALSALSVSESYNGKLRDDGVSANDGVVDAMNRCGDDLLGKVLMRDVARNIEEDTGMFKDGYRLIYKSDYVTPEGLHYVHFNTDGRYKVCYLKGLREGLEHAQHGGNNVWFVVCLNTFSYWQKCHSEDCKDFYARCLAKVSPNDEGYHRCCKKAKSESMKLWDVLHERILNFLKFNDVLDDWDAFSNEVSAFDGGSREKTTKKEDKTA